MKHALLICSLTASALALTGCAGLNSHFSCPMKPGVLCKSLDQVNTMVDQGKLGGPEGSQGKVKIAQTNFTTPYPTLAMQPGDPIRYGETVLRVWFAPYVDKDGNYYQPTVLYTVVKPGHWLDQPVKAITSEGDRV